MRAGGIVVSKGSLIEGEDFEAVGDNLFTRR